MERGYIKTWRRIVDSGIYGNSDLKAVWLHCLITAQWRDASIPLFIGRGTTNVKLKRGQCLYGRNAWSAVLGIPGRTVDYQVKKLAEMGCLARQVGSHYTVLTVANYSTYQSGADDDGQGSCHPIATQLPQRRRKERKKLRIRTEIVHLAMHPQLRRIPPSRT